MQRSILCEACKVFEPIFEYQSPMYEKNIKPEFLLLDIVLIVKTFGGEVGGFGGEASPLHPPVDETLWQTNVSLVERIDSVSSG